MELWNSPPSLLQVENPCTQPCCNPCFMKLLVFNAGMYYFLKTKVSLKYVLLFSQVGICNWLCGV
jgi:hypothetical protein